MARGENQESLSRRDEQTNELLQARCHGDPTERARLDDAVVRLNLGLCEALASRYARRGAEREDLVQVARTALVLAVERFDPHRQASFTAFAIPTICGELKRYFRDYCWTVRPPRRLQELRSRVSRQALGVEQRLGRRPTPKELATQLRVDEDTLREVIVADGGYRAVSLSAQVGRPDGTEDTSIEATLAAESDVAETVANGLTLQALVSDFSDDEQRILEWRFAEDCSQRTIADRLGVSQMHVSRVLGRLLTSLRRAWLEADQGIPVSTRC